jgi:homoserine O-succinyltransferase
MTIVLPASYHATSALQQSGIECITRDMALRQDIRALRIGILNIMPQAEDYEVSLLGPLGCSIMQIEPVFIRLYRHNYKSSNLDHLKELYVFFDEAVRHEPLDGLIVTGAPVEELAYEEVTYWHELSEILSYARTFIPSTMGICWGGMALAKMLGIDKIRFKKKLFGVFESQTRTLSHPLTQTFDDLFYCPHSRHSGLDDQLVLAAEREQVLRILATSQEAGHFIFESWDGRFISHLGHPEYEASRLVFEAERDARLGRSDVEPPQHFDLSRPHNRWRSHCQQFFTQWIKYVHQRWQLAATRPEGSLFHCGITAQDLEKYGDFPQIIDRLD